MDDSSRSGGRLFRSGTDASPSRLSACARIQDSGAVPCSHRRLHLYRRNGGIPTTALLVWRECWFVSCGSRCSWLVLAAGWFETPGWIGSHHHVVKISAEIVGEHLQPNVSLFLGKRLGLKNDVAQSRQFTVREYVVDLHSANANMLIRPRFLNTGA
jgi:hypothetical protein